MQSEFWGLKKFLRKERNCHLTPKEEHEEMQISGKVFPTEVKYAQFKGLGLLLRFSNPTIATAFQRREAGKVRMA